MTHEESNSAELPDVEDIRNEKTNSFPRMLGFISHYTEQQHWLEKFAACVVPVPSIVDPDPDVFVRIWIRIRTGILLSTSKKVRKTWMSTIYWLLFDFLSIKTDSADYRNAVNDYDKSPRKIRIRIWSRILSQ